MMMIYDDGDEGLMKRKMKMMVAWVDLWLLWRFRHGDEEGGCGGFVMGCYGGWWLMVIDGGWRKLMACGDDEGDGWGVGYMGSRACVIVG